MHSFTNLFLLFSLFFGVFGQTLVPLGPPKENWDNAVWEGTFQPNGTLPPNFASVFQVDIPPGIAKGKSLSMYHLFLIFVLVFFLLPKFLVFVKRALEGTLAPSVFQVDVPTE